MASKLSQIQAKFQQKQMQEKEEKLLRLYENQQQRAFERVNRGSAGSNTSTTSTTSNGGKVRQMFDERRQKAGIDRSYPLEPLKTNNGLGADRFKSNNKTTSSRTVMKTTVQKSISQVKNGKPIVNKREVVHSIYNNNDGDETYEEHRYEDDNSNPYRPALENLTDHQRFNYNLDDEELPDLGIDEYDESPVKGKLSNVGRKLPTQNSLPNTKVEQQKLSTKENGSTVEKIEPAAKRETKSFVKKTVNRVVANSPAQAARSNHSAENNPSKRVPPQKPSIDSMANKGSSAASQKRMVLPPSDQRAPSANRPSARQSSIRSSVARDDLELCKHCNRRFAADRLAVHEDICAKTLKKKRRAYDATKHRVQGTELEPYVRKISRNPSTKLTNQDNAAPSISKQQKQSGSAKSVHKKSDWRRKHEEFIGTIRAAKMAQAHIAKGGKISDLPPPPPSYNPDYVQCPHCGRNFNQTAAERHIPKCATYEYNKPKPGGKTSGSAKMR